MYNVKLPQPFTGSRYGLPFKDGEGMTDSAWIADQLRSTGFSVESIEDSPDPVEHQKGGAARVIKKRKNP